MSIRNIDIILVILAGRTVRFETASGTLLILPRKERATLAEAVTTSLKAKPVKGGARIFIMAAEFFTQVVRLPALQTNGLSEADLLSALIFEVEPFSNISRDQGQAAYSASEESAGIFAWHVLQIATSDIIAMTAAVRGAKAKLAGLAQVDALFLSVPEQELPGLLRSIAGEAVASAPSFPIIVPAPTCLATRKLALVACLALAFVCIGSLLHFSLTTRNQAALQARVSQGEALESANQQLEAAVKTLQATLDALEKKRADRAAAAKELERYRQVWAALIRSIPEACGSDVVLQQIEAGPHFDAEITGLSIAEKGPGECMAKLAQRICDIGWRLHAERMQAVTSAGGVEALRFSFHVSLDHEIKP